jgi:hypothetical protein
MGRKLQLLPVRASMPHKKNSSISLKLTTMVRTRTKACEATEIFRPNNTENTETKAKSNSHNMCSQ